MTRADIQGHVFTQAEQPVGRLVRVDYDGQRRVMGFLVPSLSRPRVYGLELCCRTGQICCGCEAYQDFRNSRSMPYRREVAGTFLEQLYPAIYPLITRDPRFCCPHARRVRQWLQRHKAPDGQSLYQHMNAIVQAWESQEMEKESA